MDEMKVRIAKLLSEQNICSRKKAEAWVESQFVKVNGQLLEKPEHKINPTDFILIDKKAIHAAERQKTILMNKPKNFVSSFDDPKYKLALSLATKSNYAGKKLVDFDPKTFGVVGRLDADSRGLLLYSQDGTFAKSIIGETVSVEKEYIVKVKEKITPEKLSLLQFGLSLDGKPLKRAKVKVIKEQTLNFTLTEGKNRQIRRMCGAVELEVIDLFRIRIGDIRLPENLAEGKWIFLDEI